MSQLCSQVGPKGGRCRKLAIVAGSFSLDFCRQHQEAVRSGMPQFCRRCNRMVSNKGPKQQQEAPKP